jgi:Ca2+-binding RTX toxin-like protein
LDNNPNDGIACPGTGCQSANMAMDLEHVVGGAANETLSGTNGHDVLEGGGGTNSLSGAAGNDLLLASQSGTDDLYGGPDRDTVSFAAYAAGVGTTVTQDGLANDGPAGHRTSNVGSDVEIVVGTSSADSLTGNAFANTLIGGAGNDQLFGLGGNDVLVPMQNDDASSGGAGRDTLSFARSVLPVTISAGAGTASGDGADTFTGIETYLGSAHGDTFNGGPTNEVVKAHAGNDTLNGGDGDDTLKGQAGNDTFDGGLGTDACRQGTGTGTKVNCET